MKLLLDQGLPRSTASLLREAGHDAVHTAELGLSTASDREILTRARADEMVVVTLDADFHAELAITSASKPSVIRLRIEGLRAEATAELLLEVLRRCGAALEAGAVASVQAGRLRIRRLPVQGDSEDTRATE